MFGINQTLVNLVCIFVLQSDVLAANRITFSATHRKEFFILHASLCNRKANCFGHQFC